MIKLLSHFYHVHIWLNAGLVNIEVGQYSSNFLPADIEYQSNNTIVLESDGLGGSTRFWNAVDIVQAQGFEIRSTMVLHEEMNSYSEGEFDIDNIIKVLFVK